MVKGDVSELEKLLKNQSEIDFNEHFDVMCGDFPLIVAIRNKKLEVSVLTSKRNGNQ